jgi:hypothetical protein
MLRLRVRTKAFCLVRSCFRLVLRGLGYPQCGQRKRNGEKETKADPSLRFGMTVLRKMAKGRMTALGEWLRTGGLA